MALSININTYQHIRVLTVAVQSFAGSALINLALGFRLQNKNQCIVQALAFLFRYLRLCDNSQVLSL